MPPAGHASSSASPPRDGALECGEARFTALGEISHRAPAPIPSRRAGNPEMPVMVGTPGGIYQPLKAAMARRTPKFPTRVAGLTPAKRSIIFRTWLQQGHYHPQVRNRRCSPSRAGSWG